MTRGKLNYRWTDDDMQSPGTPSSLGCPIVIRTREIIVNVICWVRPEDPWRSYTENCEG